MKLHSLKPKEGSTHKRKRLGRGEASGKGGTSTKGNKGQQSRTGYSQKLGHEGGQMPIQRRLPKRGFKNINTVKYKIFNLGDIDRIVSAYEITDFSPETLYLNKLIGREDKVKLLASGEVKSTKMKLVVHAASKKAQEHAAKFGCTVEILPRPIKAEVATPPKK